MSYREKYRVRPGQKVHLDEYDPDDRGTIDGKSAGKKILKKNIRALNDLQYLLYAESKHALLVVLQAMDAAGKDGTIRHVFGPLNPQGVRVTSFKAPTAEERAHDFLWRIHRATPRLGEIGIFNRSHYEDVLVVRVHDLVPKSVWKKRYEQINAFEKLLAENKVHALKFYLHISREEQKARFQKRLDDPDRHWKVSPADFSERMHWDAYTKAFEDALGHCSTEHAPWFVIPANHKWYRNVVISEIVKETLEGLKMRFPEPCIDVSTVRLE